jgi:hypothetical protein
MPRVVAIDGRYECALCGVVVDIPGTKGPFIVADIVSGSGVVRTVSYGRVELHRCNHEASDSGRAPTERTP